MLVEQCCGTVMVEQCGRTLRWNSGIVLAEQRWWSSYGGTVEQYWWNSDGGRVW